MILRKQSVQWTAYRPREGRWVALNCVKTEGVHSGCFPVADSLVVYHVTITRSDCKHKITSSIDQMYMSSLHTELQQRPLSVPLLHWCRNSLVCRNRVVEDSKLRWKGALNWMRATYPRDNISLNISVSKWAGTMSMLRKIQRVGKRATKFQYTATYQSVVVESLRDKWWVPKLWSIQTCLRMYKSCRSMSLHFSNCSAYCIDSGPLSGS